MDRKALRCWYMWSVAVAGVAASGFCAFTLPLAQLDLRLVVLVLITVIIGSRITIPIPRAKGHISVSDTFIFLTMLLFGTEAAVLLAATEAFSSSIHLTKRPLVRLFNAGVMACSTLITASVVSFVFGSLTSLRDSYSPNLVVALCAMALLQYCLNSGMVALSVALKFNQPVWATWHANFLWTSITYFAGASAAGIVAPVIGQAGFYALVATAPIIAIIYLTYRTYLRNIETSARQTEQAKLHVEELNRFIVEQERISKALQESEAHFRTAFDLCGHRDGARFTRRALAAGEPVLMRFAWLPRRRIAGV